MQKYNFPVHSKCFLRLYKYNIEVLYIFSNIFDHFVGLRLSTYLKKYEGNQTELTICLSCLR